MFPSKRILFHLPSLSRSLSFSFFLSTVGCVLQAYLSRSLCVSVCVCMCLLSLVLFVTEDGFRELNADEELFRFKWSLLCWMKIKSHLPPPLTPFSLFLLVPLPITPSKCPSLYKQNKYIYIKPPIPLPMALRFRIAFLGFSLCFLSISFLLSLILSFYTKE